MRIILLGLILLVSPLFALEGKHVKVYDGDALTVLDSNHTSYRIRLADAPEMRQSWSKHWNHPIVL